MKLVNLCQYSILMVVAIMALAACAPMAPLVSIPQSLAQSTPAISGSIEETPAREHPAVPSFSHIYVIVMENKVYGRIVGNPSAPYINQLIGRYGLATNYNAVAHPSQPNYLALLSGSTQGVTNAEVHQVSGRNLLDQIEAGGKTWKIYAQDMPGCCYTGATASSGYARRHDPAISFVRISGSPSRRANITDFAHFDPSAANFELIIPNVCNDLHSCGAATGDSFLKTLVPKILDSRGWQQSGVLFVVWDEGTSKSGGGGRIPLLVISNKCRRISAQPSPTTTIRFCGRLRTPGDWAVSTRRARQIVRPSSFIDKGSSE